MLGGYPAFLEVSAVCLECARRAFGHSVFQGYPHRVSGGLCSVLQMSAGIASDWFFGLRVAVFLAVAGLGF